MNSKTRSERSGLHELLPDAPFRSHHSGIVDAPREAVFEALHGLRWSDLRVGAPLMALRGPRGSVGDGSILDMFSRRAGAIVVEDRPSSLWSVMVGRPWSAIPRHAPVASVDDVRAFTEPGWLRYGMDWQLHDLGDGRTLVETSTLCDPTDAGARRAFTLYWGLIRLGSGAIRLDMLASLRRLTAGR